MATVNELLQEVNVYACAQATGLSKSEIQAVKTYGEDVTGEGAGAAVLAFAKGASPTPAAPVKAKVAEKVEAKKEDKKILR